MDYKMHRNIVTQKEIVVLIILNNKDSAYMPGTVPGLQYGSVPVSICIARDVVFSFLRIKAVFTHFIIEKHYILNSPDMILASRSSYVFIVFI